MLAIYGVALAIGGILVGLPAVLGQHGLGGGHAGLGHAGLGHAGLGHGGLGHGGGLTHGHPGMGHAGHGHGGAGHGAAGAAPGIGATLGSVLWLTVLSIRFWSFAAAFFGLTGVVLDGLKLASSENETLGLAIGLGLGSGLLASWLVTRIREDVVSGIPTEDGFVGLAANVLLEIQPTEAGRISLSARGAVVDLPARSQKGERLAAGAKVVVVSVQQGVATVVAAPAV